MTKQPIQDQIWDAKYRFKKADGTPIDQDVTDTWSRIATALVKPEKPNRGKRYNEFYDALSDYKFMPAGRITAGAGTGRAVTLFNCFVMGTVPDSMDGIFEMLKEAALTMQQGGGIGYDFSTIRPQGAPVKGVAADASGPLTFMDVWDAMCRTVMSAGSRRGAMMATMRCDHPDILQFITAKRDATKLRMFNLSVLVTDEFMNAVKEDYPWFFYWNGEKYGSPVRARDLWDEIMQGTYAQAEPGVIFIDRINQTNNLNYCETIAATNPCGEQPLPPYGACLLGSINLAALVENAFTFESEIPLKKLRKLVATAVRMLDNVIDVSNFPLEAQSEEAMNKRRIGLGVTGLADALAMMKTVYGSDGAVALTRLWMKEIRDQAYETSTELAKEKGAFPLFDADKFLAPGTHASTLPKTIQNRIRKYGIRNSHLTTVAPNGTISLYAGNVSSGIEPIFAPEYTRKVLEKDGSKREEMVYDYAVLAYKRFFDSRSPQGFGFGMNGHNGELPDYFVSAQTLSPADHVRMQAAVQEFVDSSISKTINCPEDISFEEFKNVYLQAWDSGCKGCTTYRPNEITGSVLSVEPETPAPANDEERRFMVFDTAEPRPGRVEGATYKVKLGDSKHALYVTVNHVGSRPVELFLNTKNPEHYVWTTALSRVVSALFRTCDDATFLVEELQQVFDPSGGGFEGGRYVPSIIAAIGHRIQQHMIEIGYITGEPVTGYPAVSVPPVNVTFCPSCSGTNYVVQNGCATCGDCGDSKCG